jgi:hypothetical protein
MQVVILINLNRMEEQLEIQRQYSRQLEKYIYYLIALCVTAIGFSVHITIGLPLSYSQIPLGIAVLSWALSVFCGLRQISLGLNILYLNNAFFDIIQGFSEISGSHPEKIEIGKKALTNFMSKDYRKASKFGKWQDRLFFLGMILFIIWHLVEMYLKTEYKL